MACYTQKSLFIAFTCYRSCSNDVNYPLDHNFYIWIERICFRNFLSARLDEFLAGITLAFSTSSRCLHVSQVLARSNHNLRNRTLVNVSFVHRRALLWVQMFLPSPSFNTWYLSQPTRPLVVPIQPSVEFPIGTRKNCFSHSLRCYTRCKSLHTVLSQDNFLSGSYALSSVKFLYLKFRVLKNYKYQLCLLLLHSILDQVPRSSRSLNLWSTHFGDNCSRICQIKIKQNLCFDFVHREIVQLTTRSRKVGSDNFSLYAAKVRCIESHEYKLGSNL